MAQRNDTFRLEYLIIDGGSTDGSLEIIQRYAENLAWWVSEPDRGQAQAINKGFQRAQGEIIAWLNSDDLYLPGAISSAVQALKSSPASGMVFGNALTIDARGVPLNRLVFGDWGLAELTRFRIICQPAVFMRKAVLDQAGYLDTKYHYMLDHQLWLKIASLAPIKHVEGFWAAARHHAGAKNVAQAAEFSRETMRLLDWVQAHPELSDYVSRNSRQVIGGATRLSARYYLDGGMPFKALLAYTKAFWYYPAYTLQHWHRILYALLCVLGGKSLAGWYNRLRAQADVSDIYGLENWYGLCLKKP